MSDSTTAPGRDGMFTRKRLLVGAAVLVAVAAGAPSAVAAVTSSTPTVYYACVKNSTGAMRQVSASTNCVTGEHRISWNNVGPRGPQGGQGPKGATGATGAPGATGAAGGGGATGAPGGTGPQSIQAVQGPPGLSNYVLVTSSVPVAGLTAQEVRAYCPDGAKVLGGGFSDDVSINSAQQFAVSRAISVQGTVTPDYFSAQLENYQDPNAAGTTVNLTVTATCATVASAPGAPAAAPAHSRSRPTVLHAQHLSPR